MRASEDSKFARAAEWMPRLTGGSTGGRGMAEWQHRADRQPFLRPRGAGLLPAGARAYRQLSVSHEHGRAQEALAIFGECNDVL